MSVLSAICLHFAHFTSLNLNLNYNSKCSIILISFFLFCRYIFKNKEKVGLQELGPRFTLKLRWLQKGAFDTKFGEYEWIHKVLSNIMFYQ